MYKADEKTSKMVATTISVDRKELHIGTPGNYDGKEYPVTGNPITGSGRDEKGVAYNNPLVLRER